MAANRTLTKVSARPHRTQVGRMLRLISIAPDTIGAILRGHEPDGIRLPQRRNNLASAVEEQRRRWS